MHINITKRILGKMNADDLEIIDLAPEKVHGLDYFSVNLSNLSQNRIDKLRETLVRLKNSGTRRIDILLNDIDLWNKVVRDGINGRERARTLVQFSDLLVEYIRKSPGQRIYKKEDNANTWHAYYVNYVDYEREKKLRDHYVEAHVEIHLLYWLLGNQYNRTLTFYNDNVDGRSVVDVLSESGWFIETKELRDNYLIAKQKFDEIFPQIGKQYLVRGQGMTLSKDWRGHRLPMMQDGVPAKVVVDVRNEPGDESGSNQTSSVRPNFWAGRKPQSIKPENSEDLYENRQALDKNDYSVLATSPEVPIHPYVPIYHLSYHNRYRVHAMNMEEYIFNKELGEQLILPDITKNLVNVLVSQGRVSFADIIEGKGNGVCVLLTGPPGVGKTLTAEVFAEATERPLLSVQAAQLGVSADTIEKNLISVLRRGNRWNAVILLDEADVYINERGDNIAQNAIVAAILRILENHTSTIFMTTNHPERVDDAISSRCIARIDYEKPDIENQKQIWKVLNDLNSIQLVDDQINEIVEKHNDLSGRDIKQIIKLASMWSESHGQPVDVNTITFVKEFLPTRVFRSQNGKLSNMFVFENASH